MAVACYSSLGGPCTPEFFGGAAASLWINGERMRRRFRLCQSLVRLYWTLAPDAASAAMLFRTAASRYISRPGALGRDGNATRRLAERRRSPAPAPARFRALASKDTGKAAKRVRGTRVLLGSCSSWVTCAHSFIVLESVRVNPVNGAVLTRPLAHIQTKAVCRDFLARTRSAIAKSIIQSHERAVVQRRPV